VRIIKFKISAYAFRILQMICQLLSKKNEEVALRMRRWGYQTLKSIFIAALMYRFARFFMKKTTKETDEKKKSKKKFRKQSGS
jgi:hypothetical protein